MASVNYSLAQALSDYTTLLSEDKTFIIFAVAALVFVIVVAMNIENKNASFLFLGLNAVLVCIIIFTYGWEIIDNIDTFFKLDLYKNMYFFFANSVVSLCLISALYKSKRAEKNFKILLMFIYYPLLVNLIFMISISNYFQNISLITLFNAYPMVYVGNIISFVLYGVAILNWLLFMKKKKKHRLGNHL